VFHKIAKHELSRKELAQMVIQEEEEKERLLLENKQLEAQTEPQQVVIEQKDKTITKLQPKADFAEVAFKKIGKVIEQIEK